MGFPIPDTGSVTEDSGVVGGLLTATGDIDYFLFDDTGEWTAVTNDTSLGFGSSFSMDDDGNWVFTVDNSDPGIQALNSGESLDFQYTVSSANGDSTVTITVFGVDEPPCFVKGAMVETPFGPRPIETLSVGDQILTQDHGPVKVRWIGSKLLEELNASDRQNLAPIEIHANALGPGSPSRTIQVSPLHRLLVSGSVAELYFGVREVLCPAKSLVNGNSIRVVEPDRVEYFHILLDEHQIVRADGFDSETLYPGRQGLYRFGAKEQEEIFALFPELRAMPETYGKSARRILKGFEAKLLAEAF